MVLGAKNGTRTRDPDLGKVVLYQLSYFRKFQCALQAVCLRLRGDFLCLWGSFSRLRCKGRHYF